MRATATWLCAALVALLLAASGPALDGLPDATAEIDAARAAELAQDIDLTQQRMERAASALCRAEAGPHATAVFTPGGEVVCAAADSTHLLAASEAP